MLKHNKIQILGDFNFHQSTFLVTYLYFYFIHRCFNALQEVSAEVDEKESRVVHGVREDVAAVLRPDRVGPVLPGHLRAPRASQRGRAPLRLGAEGFLPRQRR